MKGLIDRIVAVDKQLALTAINTSKADAKDIAKAREELAAGDSDAAKGKYESAIEHYRNAWDQAGKKSENSDHHDENNGGDKGGDNGQGHEGGAGGGGGAGKEN